MIAIIIPDISLNVRNCFPFNVFDTHELLSLNDIFLPFSHRKMQRELRRKSKAGNRIKNSSKSTSEHRTKNIKNKSAEWTRK